MTNLRDKAALIIDHGTFVELALRLAREDGFGRVYYCDPTWQEAFAKIDHAVIGDGYPGVIRVKEPWNLIDSGKVDIAIFPDVHRAEEQRHIESLGVPVWGGRTADRLELNKLRFKELQHDLKMPHAEYDVIHGTEELREHCRETEDRYIKITPQFRGNRETFHHKTYQESKEKLAQMDLEFGFLGEAIIFLSEKPLKGDLEGGIDTYAIDGAHPQVAVSGWEAKDKAYFAEVLKYADLPEPLRTAVDPLWPVLKKHRSRQMVSTEVKMVERVLLEPTIRFPSPAGEEQMELYGNFPQIIWEGAHGRLIEPELTAKFACEAMMERDGSDEGWSGLKIPDDIRRWVKLYNTARLGKITGSGPGSNIIGAAVGIGDTPLQALYNLLVVKHALKSEPVDIHAHAIGDLLVEIKKAQKLGLAFVGQDLPDPGLVFLDPEEIGPYGRWAKTRSGGQGSGANGSDQTAGNGAGASGQPGVLMTSSDVLTSSEQLIS